jgi:hypothetical protein
MRIKIFIIAIICIALLITGCTGSTNYHPSPVPTISKATISLTPTPTPIITLKPTPTLRPFTPSPSQSYYYPTAPPDTGSLTSGLSLYYASSKSDVFHKPGCYHVKQIKSGNLISFSSRQAAINAGYRPCKDCNP